MMRSSQTELENASMKLTPSTSLKEVRLDVSILPGKYDGKPACGLDLSISENGKVPSGCSLIDKVTTTTTTSKSESKFPVTLMPRMSSGKKLEGYDLESSRILLQRQLDDSLALFSKSRTSRPKLTRPSKSAPTWRTTDGSTSPAPVTTDMKERSHDKPDDGNLQSHMILCRQYSFMSDITMDDSIPVVLQSRTSRSKLMRSSKSVTSLKESHRIHKTSTDGGSPLSASVKYDMKKERSHDRSVRSTNAIASTKKESRKSQLKDRSSKSLTSKEQTSCTFSHHGSKIPSKPLSVGKLRPEKRKEQSSLTKRTTDSVASTLDVLKTEFPAEIIRQQHSVKSDIGLYSESLSRHRRRLSRKSNLSISGIESQTSSIIASSTTQSLTSHRDRELARSSRDVQEDYNGGNISIKSERFDRTTTNDDSCRSCKTESQSQSRTSRSHRSLVQTGTKKKKMRADSSWSSLQRLAHASSVSSEKPSFHQKDDAIFPRKSRSSAVSSESPSRGVEMEEEAAPSTPHRQIGGTESDTSKIRGTTHRDDDDVCLLSKSEALPKKKAKSAKTKKESVSSKSLSIVSNKGTESRTEQTKSQGGLKTDVAPQEEACRPTRTQRQSSAEAPQSTLDRVLSLHTLNVGERTCPSNRSLPSSFRSNSARSEQRTCEMTPKTSKATRSLSLHYKSPKDEQFKYMMAQLRRDRQKADEERNMLLALKGNLNGEGSYKEVQSYMKQYVEGSIGSLELSPKPDLEGSSSSHPLPWLCTL